VPTPPVPPLHCALHPAIDQDRIFPHLEKTFLVDPVNSDSKSPVNTAIVGNNQTNKNTNKKKKNKHFNKEI
jgi:hypothetical protein